MKPQAVRSEIVEILDVSIGVHLLDDGRRLLDLDMASSILVGVLGTDLSTLSRSNVVSGLIERDTIEEGIVEFDSSDGAALGIEASALGSALSAWSLAVSRKMPMNLLQKKTAERCAGLLEACGEDGPAGFALRAVGKGETDVYERIGPDGSRRRIFPKELWTEFSRLTGRPRPKKGMAPWWGKLVNWTIYDTLDPEVVARIAEIRLEFGGSWHRRAADESAVQAVADRCREVIALAAVSVDDYDLRRRVDARHGRGSFQMDLMDMLDAPRTSEREIRSRSSALGDRVSPLGK